MKKLTKKQVGMIAATVLLLGAGGTFYVVQSNNQKVEAAQRIVSKEQSQLTALKKDLENSFDSKKPDYLAKNVTKKQGKEYQAIYDRAAKKIKANVKLSNPKQKEKGDPTQHDCQELLKLLTEKIDTQEAINQLYQTTEKNVAMNGVKINKDLSIIDELKTETVEQTKKACFIEGATTEYEKTVNALLSGAEDQLNQIDKAKAAVAKVYKDSKVISTDKKLYDSAKAETDKVKNAKAKKALNDQLAKVKVDLDKKAKEVQEKATTEQAAQDQAQTQANTTNENQSVAANDTNGYNDQAATDQAPAYDGGGYTAPATNNDAAGYQPPANAAPTENNANQAADPAPAPSAGGNGQGVLTQDQMNKAAEDASNMDPTTDPNSPWHK